MGLWHFYGLQVIEYINFMHVIVELSFFLSFFSVLAFELRAYTLSHSANPFVRVFFKIVSCELFAQDGFEP
jgi:hypothetical protein